MYFVVGGVVMAGRELLAGATRRARELEARQRRMTEEQSSLRRVATAVAAGSPPAGIFALVSLDAGHLLGADCAAIVRFQSAERVIVLGRWTHDEHGAEDPDATVDVRPGSLLARLRSGEPIARDRMDGEHDCIRLAAPVRHCAAVWARSSSWPPTHTSSPPAPRSACTTTPTSSPPRWPTPRIAPGSMPRRRPTRSPACPTTAPSASGWPRR